MNAIDLLAAYVVPNRPRLDAVVDDLRALRTWIERWWLIRDYARPVHATRLCAIHRDAFVLALRSSHAFGCAKVVVRSLAVSLSFANDRVVVPSGVVSRRVNEATVLLNSVTGQYFTLDDIGTRAWTALTASGSIQIAYEALLAEFDADPEHLKNDLERLIENLQDQGLLELRRV